MHDHTIYHKESTGIQFLGQIVHLMMGIERRRLVASQEERLGPFLCGEALEQGSRITLHLLFTLFPRVVDPCLASLSHSIVSGALAFAHSRQQMRRPNWAGKDGGVYIVIVFLEEIKRLMIMRMIDIGGP